MGYFTDSAPSNRTRCVLCKNQISLHDFRLIKEYRTGYNAMYKSRKYYCSECAVNHLIVGSRQDKSFIKKVEQTIKDYPKLKQRLNRTIRLKKEHIKYKFKNCIDKR
jgi:hypothetical protein